LNIFETFLKSKDDIQQRACIKYIRNNCHQAFFKINIASLAAKVNNTSGVLIAFQNGFHNYDYMNGVSLLEICSTANQYVCCNYLVDDCIDKNKE